jgi:glutamate-1-semialdehyde 2,1-aminomutase
MTGFRLAPGGAQERFGIQPDLSTFGKIIGGGLPVGALGGRADIMDYLAPLGPVYQAGTLSGNPLAMAAGIAALEELGAVAALYERRSGGGDTPPLQVYTQLEQLGAQLEAGMRDAAKSAGVPVTFNRCGSMFCGYFTSEPVWNLADAMKSDRERFKKFFHGMLDAGIYLAPSQFEAGFISMAHSEADIEKTVNAAAVVLNGISSQEIQL